MSPGNQEIKTCNCLAENVKIHWFQGLILLSVRAEAMVIADGEKKQCRERGEGQGGLWP